MLPLTGVPVPLLSFGGTSLIVTLAAIGMVLSVAAARSRAAAARALPGRAAACRRRAPSQARPRRAGLRRPLGCLHDWIVIAAGGTAGT